MSKYLMYYEKTKNTKWIEVGLTGNVYSSTLMSNYNHGYCSGDDIFTFRDLNEIACFIAGYLYSGRKFPFTNLDSLKWKDGIKLLILLSNIHHSFRENDKLNSLKEHVLEKCPEDKKNDVKKILEILKTKPWALSPRKIKFNISR